MAFNIGFYAYAIIGYTRADQLLPQLLMEQFDTFPIQCRNIEHMHEGVLYPRQTLFVVGILFSPCPCMRACVYACVHPCVRPSVRNVLFPQ